MIRSELAKKWPKTAAIAKRIFRSYQLKGELATIESITDAEKRELYEVYSVESPHFITSLMLTHNADFQPIFTRLLKFGNTENTLNDFKAQFQYILPKHLDEFISEFFEELYFSECSNYFIEGNSNAYSNA